MISVHITANGRYRLDQPFGATGELISLDMENGYLVYALRGTSFGTSGAVALQYSPDQGTSWMTLEGHSSTAATNPLIVGSCRGPVYWPGALLSLNVTGSSGGTDFYLDYAIGTF